MQKLLTFLQHNGSVVYKAFEKNGILLKKNHDIGLGFSIRAGNSRNYSEVDKLYRTMSTLRYSL